MYYQQVYYTVQYKISKNNISNDCTDLDQQSHTVVACFAADSVVQQVLA